TPRSSATSRRRTTSAASASPRRSPRSSCSCARSRRATSSARRSPSTAAATSSDAAPTPAPSPSPSPLPLGRFVGHTPTKRPNAASEPRGVCDTLCLIGRDRTVFAKSSDRPVREAQVVESFGPRPRGVSVRAQYVDVPDAGAMPVLGSRPAWLWGFEHGVNERRVAMGNERVWTVDDARVAPRALIGMDLVRLALERAANADEAIDVATSLLERHGQGGSGEEEHDEPYFSSFLVADPSSAWVLETSARTWAARPVEDGASISNRVSLGRDWTRASSDVPPDADFGAWRDPTQPTGHADVRLAATGACVATSARAVSARDVVATLRHHGERPWGRPGAAADDVSPLPTRIEADGTGVTVCMHLRGYQATAASMVAELPATRTSRCALGSRSAARARACTSPCSRPRPCPRSSPAPRRGRGSPRCDLVWSRTLTRSLACGPGSPPSRPSCGTRPTTPSPPAPRPRCVVWSTARGRSWTTHCGRCASDALSACPGAPGARYVRRPSGAGANECGRSRAVCGARDGPARGSHVIVQFNLADLFEIVVDTVPDREALVCGDRRLTYRELEARVNRLAHHLAASGVGAGDHVALYLYNGTEYLEAMLAAYKVRAVPINVNYRYVEEELRYLLDDCDAVAVVFHCEFAPKLVAIREQLPNLRAFVAVDDGSDTHDAARTLGATDYEDALAHASPARDFAPRSADDLYILYTGGTTGMPKGVMWRHEDIFFGAFGGGGIGN